MSVINKYKKTVAVVLLLCAMFFAGRGVGYLTEKFTQGKGEECGWTK